MIEFRLSDSGVTLSVTSRDGTVLHESEHKKKKHAASHLARLRGQLREKPTAVKVSGRIKDDLGDTSETDGSDQIQAAVDKHHGHYALLECMEVLSQYPESDVTTKAWRALNIIFGESTGEAVDST